MGVVEMKEFRLIAFDLKKITMTAYAAPTFFFVQNFSNSTLPYLDKP